MTILREIKNLINYNFQHTERMANHDHFNVFKKALRDLSLVGFQDIRAKDVLDLGCGQRFSFALQCAANGANVTALDIDYVKPDKLALYFLRCITYGGFKRAVKSIIRRMIFDKKYYKALEVHAGKPIFACADNIEYVTADHNNSKYPLPSETYDLIVSNAVLEHIVDVPAFVLEVKRLLKPGGYFYGIVHNYYSISGGHNMEWAFPDDYPSKTVPPWDHLRDNNYPSHVYLNRYLPEQYENAFAKILKIRLFEKRDVNHDSKMQEGESFLTSQVAEEISSYPHDLLVTRAYCIICQNNHLI